MKIMAAPKMPNTIAKIPELVGTGNVGSVIATATAFHAATDGAENWHVNASALRMQGYALEKSTKRAGARNTATMVPRPCAIHC